MIKLDMLGIFMASEAGNFNISHRSVQHLVCNLVKGDGDSPGVSRDKHYRFRFRFFYLSYIFVHNRIYKNIYIA